MTILNRYLSFDAFALTLNHYFLTLKLLPILALGLVDCGGNDEPTVDRTAAEPIALLSV